MTLAKWFDFKTISDPRGQLVAAEVNTHVPFDIRRIYYLRDLKADEPRGFHAHKALEQIAICVAGACTIVLDNGRIREQIRLNDPARGLYIAPMIWHEMQDFSPGCILLVLASDVYDEADYIRDFDTFSEAAS